jgi:hypothetical protein
VAREPPGESIAHENEIVEQIANEVGVPEQPADVSVEEQLTDAMSRRHGRRTGYHDQRTALTLE